MDKTFYVYVLSSRSRNLYIGVTSDLAVLGAQHKTKALPGHTARYGIDRLAYFEDCPNPEDAIIREEQLKGRLHRKKVTLIESVNPAWDDLSSKL